MTQPNFATHEVFNQSPPFEDVNLFTLDQPLVAAVKANGGAAAERELSAFGKEWGSAAMADRGRLANENTPKLRSFDAKGHRRDQVEFHPAYHELMAHSAHAGVHNSTWTADGRPADDAAEVIRAAKFYMAAQVETGHLCPITMTRASVGALAMQPDLLARVMPVLSTKSYDPGFAPWWGKRGMTLGMGMTEKQGGTDVRANTTRAERAGNGFYRITGHKWFLSAPMSDAFLVLAQAAEGHSCFLVPRILPDGSANGFRFQRLKDKLGNRSNASSEVEFEETLGQMVGQPGEGVKTIIDMVTLTRLDCAIASAGLMRAGLAEAVHHARHRQVFGAALFDQPLMQRVLADMALDVAGATALSLRLARAFDMAANDRGEAAFARVMTPVVKYWVAKIAPALLYEAMECLGGNGYIEEGNLARYYREAPVNAIWEGSGNVMALDVRRVLLRAPKLFDDVLAWIARQLGRGGQGTVDVLRAAMSVAESDEGAARILTEQLALAAAGAELRQLGADAIADAFVETRLAGQWRTTYGMIDARHNSKTILNSLYPAA